MFQAGEQIDNFIIESNIGEGGMGQVYLATDTVLGRKVAIKVLSADFTENDEALARFMLEAKAVAKMTHENIVSIYSMGVFKESQYIVMEYVDGQPLSKCFSESTFGLLEVISIIKQVLQGVQAAHLKQILHRDIKPANIVIDDKFTAKILDFGIAKELGADNDGLTKDNEVWGTIDYMAPEVLKGFQPTVQSDIFSIGVVLFELLCGYKPFMGKNSWEVIEEIRSKEVKIDPSIRDVVPKMLQSICLRMLEKDPQIRYSNIPQILEDFAKIELKDCEVLLERAPSITASIQNLDQLRSYLKEKGHGSLEINTILNRALFRLESEAKETDATLCISDGSSEKVSLDIDLVEAIRVEFVTKKESLTQKAARQRMESRLKKSKKVRKKSSALDYFFGIGAVICILIALGLFGKIYLNKNASESASDETEVAPPQNPVATHTKLENKKPTNEPHNHKKRPKNTVNAGVEVPNPSFGIGKFVDFVGNYHYGAKIRELNGNFPLPLSRHLDREEDEIFTHKVSILSPLDLSVIKIRNSKKRFGHSEDGLIKMTEEFLQTNYVWSDNPFIPPKRYENSRIFGSGTSKYTSEALDFFPLKIGNFFNIKVYMEGSLETTSRPAACIVKNKSAVTLKSGLGPLATYKIQCRLGKDRTVIYWSPELGIHVFRVDARLLDGGWIVTTRELESYPSRFSPNFLKPRRQLSSSKQ